MKSFITSSGTDVNLVTEMNLQEAGTGTGAPWRYWPSGTYVDKPGCYAWQVDGDTFTESIVVTVRLP